MQLTVQVLASLAPTTVRLLAHTRLFAPAAPAPGAAASAAAPPDAALLFACARFLRFGAAHHTHLLLRPERPCRRPRLEGEVSCPEGEASCQQSGGEGQPSAVAAAAKCLEGLAQPRVAGVLRSADIKRARAHLLSLLLHLGDHPWCAL